MLAKDAKVKLLQGVPSFAGLSPTELAAVAAAAGEVDLPGGHHLVQQGTAAHKLGVIVDGAAEVTVGGTTVGKLGRGDAFGEIAPATGDAQAATVTTTKPTRILALSGPAYDGLVTDMPSLTKSITATSPLDSGDGHIGFD